MSKEESHIQKIAALEKLLEEQSQLLHQKDRELEIEAALDKVRVRATAMRSSSELAETSAELFHQLRELKITAIRTGVGIFDDPNNAMELWITTYSDNKEVIRVLDYFSVYVHPVFENIIAARNEEKPYALTVLRDKEVRAYYQVMSTYFSENQKEFNPEEYYYSFFFPGGTINAVTDHSLSNDECDILVRFAKVFGLIYTRFLDLQNAEAATRAAQIETALERVRAKAQAMQQPEELKEVAQVLRSEMGSLGVEELETCSIYINDPSRGKLECWYALKDSVILEKKIITDHFELDPSQTWVGREMLRYFNSEANQTSIVMTGEYRKEWIRYCEVHSPSLRGYYGENIPDRTYHFYKFSQGAIGVASAGVISEESWDLLRRAASVFSLAYSRFRDLTQARIDLQHLMEEKKRAEDALTELRATQSQLIHSEKMASLGELTAGIAHEIQNPLNFVNNFSEVSKELLEEMEAELQSGNIDEARKIASDVGDNLLKILHHGKRADGIVKGMLQHSRTSSGQKELTDLNQLADEYLRLAYHGLRAKDKSFNAKFETNLDKDVDKVSVIPQDIGRVILNLVNNAFYAVTEKRKQGLEKFEPTVTLTTRRKQDFIELSISDNGNGIPPKLLEKIFQPFFTTKAAGVGTGLGLSLSYDIITKGHNGKLSVVTDEGMGTTFTVALPV